EGMALFGINTANSLGVPIPAIRNIAKQTGKHHPLAIELWKTGIHEARILASIIDNPEKVTEIQMENWVKEFNSWDLCDQVCSNLFDKTKFAYKKAVEWSFRKEEFVKRAGFAIMAALAVQDKKAADVELEKFLPVIKRESTDERNYVKKAVNWALRNIGKRNKNLNKKAIQTAEDIKKISSPAARWIAADALKELKNEKTQNRIAKKTKK
ncbi:MAG: DNA alkylation repair protein, partial [Candidatus Altiarchaeota archaeon]